MAAHQDSSKHGGHPHFNVRLNYCGYTDFQDYTSNNIKERKERKGAEEEEEEGRELKLELENFYLTRIVV